MSNINEDLDLIGFVVEDTAYTAEATENVFTFRGVTYRTWFCFNTETGETLAPINMPVFLESDKTIDALRTYATETFKNKHEV